MMVRMDVFVNVKWSPDVRNPVIPIEESINHDSVDHHLDDESSDVESGMSAVNLCVMQVPNCAERPSHHECWHTVHMCFQCFTYSFVPILFILFFRR